jgi:hypothetical protein
MSNMLRDGLTKKRYRYEIIVTYLPVRQTLTNPQKAVKYKSFLPGREGIFNQA